MTTDFQVCDHRGKEKQEGIFVCEVHGVCTLLKIHERIRSCDACSDFTVGTVRKPSKGLGDQIADALKVVGITQEKVTSWLGEECGCAERQEKLNQLGFWVSRVLGGKIEKAREHLAKIMGNQ